MCSSRWDDMVTTISSQLMCVSAHESVFVFILPCGWGARRVEKKRKKVGDTRVGGYVDARREFVGERRRVSSIVRPLVRSSVC